MTTHARVSRAWLAVGVAGILAALTAQRLHVWAGGDRALWQDAAAQSASPRPWINLGNAEHARGHDAAAEVDYLIAIGYADTHRSDAEFTVGGALARANLGTIYFQDNDCTAPQGEVPLQTTRLYDRACVRRNLGQQLIADAHDRYPESFEITQRFMDATR